MVKAEVTEEEIFISVRDNGEGIAPDDLPHVFDRLGPRVKKAGAAPFISPFPYGTLEACFLTAPLGLISLV